MADPIRPPPSKLIDRCLDIVSTALNQITNQEVSGAVETIVTVDSHDVLVAPSGFSGSTKFLILPDLVNELYEVRDILLTC